MVVKKGVLKVQDGVFKQQGYSMIKQVRYYNIVVLEQGSLKLMFNSEPFKTETLTTTDGENIDNTTLNEVSGTIQGSCWFGDDIESIIFRFTLGLEEPTWEWFTPLTEVTGA